MSRLLALILLFSTGLTQTVGPDELCKGMTLIRTSAQHPYDSPTAESSLTRLIKQTASNWLAIQPVWYQSDTGAAEITPQPNISPADQEIIFLINQAHRLGLKVFLKPVIKCLSGVSLLKYDSPNPRWFTAYRRFILHYARIAAQTNCELFAIGTALDRTADDHQENLEWQKTINLVRQQFKKSARPPKLVYAADWRTYQKILFWDRLDYIGINAYFPLTTEQPPLPPPEFQPGSVDYLAWYWKQKHLPEIENFLARFNPAKPLLFTEIGYPAQPHCYLAPDSFVPAITYDPTTQRNCYLAAYHALAGRPWFAGLFWFNWETDTTPNTTAGYPPRERTVLELIRRFNTALATHKGFCLPTTYDSTYLFARTFPALDSLKALGANWVAINSRWLMADTGKNYDTIKPQFGESPLDSSIKMVIDSAHQKGLFVALSCYLACSTRVWCGLHNPGADTAWFRAESAYVAHCAQLAEEKNVEMLTIGLELNSTMDSPVEAQLWRQIVLPAARALYSGPIAYGASWSPVDDYFWDGIDLAGIHPYFPLVEQNLYSGRYPIDTAINQRPTPDDICRLSPYSWQKMRIPALSELYHRIHKPLLFTEIGYRSLDSAAYGTTDTWYAWQPCHPRPTRCNLFALCFPKDTLTGYIAGDSGTVLKTTDAGKTWTRCSTSTKEPLYAIHFPVQDTGYATGAGGLIIKTTSGFATCEHQTLPRAGNFYAINFPHSTRTGYLCGDSGAIFKTTDGGTTWQRQFCLLATGETLKIRLNAMDFITDRIGYIAGAHGTILKTTDGGATWRKLKTRVKVNLNGIDFISPDTGFAVGDASLLLQTTDAGKTWLTHTFRTQDWDFNSVSVPEYDSACFIAGTRGIILRAGTAWQFNGSVQHSKTYLPLHAIQVWPQPRTGYYDLIGFAVGDAGTILKTATGGRMRVDFNEQANCYEAAFRAFWGDFKKPHPLPWFYGFHFWKWETDFAPMDIEHELRIDDYTPQGKKAAQIIKNWFNRYSPGPALPHQINPGQRD